MILPLEIMVSQSSYFIQQQIIVGCKKGDQEHSANSPCPSSSSSSSSDGSGTGSDSSSKSSEKSNGSDDEALLPPANNSDGGDEGDDHKKEKEDEDNDNGNGSDSNNENSADESEVEEDDNAEPETDDNKHKAHHGFDPTDEELSSESDGSLDLDNSYPQLPPAPVDTLIALRQQAAYKELQLNEKLKMEVIADAQQRRQERQQAQRSKRRNRTARSKRKHSTPDGFPRLANHSMIGGAEAKDLVEDEWMVDCSCGLKEKNYDDGTSMIQCDSCSHWVHAKCADKQPEAVAREKFVCFRCSWMFDCVCHVRRQPNHDDGHRMVECESCNTWQHTTCVGIPMTEEPADDYRCPRCIKKKCRYKPAAKQPRNNRNRHRKQSHNRNRRDTIAMHVHSAARPVESLSLPPPPHMSSRTKLIKACTREKKQFVTHSPSPPSFPAASPQTTPPPPPSPPPLPSVGSLHVVTRSLKDDRKCSPAQRNRGRLLPNGSPKKTRLEASDRGHLEPPQSTVTPLHRDKGLKLRDSAPAPSSQIFDVRPPLAMIPPSGKSGPGPGGRKRRSSARDRLAKKLRINKSTLR